MTNTTMFVTAIALIVLAVYVGRNRTPMVKAELSTSGIDTQKLFAGNADMTDACPPGTFAMMGKGKTRCVPSCPEGMIC